MRDVEARRDEDGTWRSLTPDRARHPLQIDLLAGDGVLTDLGGNAQLPAGHYSEIRMRLVAPAATPQRLCAAESPCVTLQTGGVVRLLLSPEAAKGVVMLPDRLPGGIWTVSPRRAAQLMLVWNACASILPESNGQFRLSPVLRAMPTAPALTAISGRVVDADGEPIAGGNVMIALEMPDRTGIDRPVLTRNATGDGRFQFAAVPGPESDEAGSASTWTLVIAAINGLNAAYAPVVVTDVPAGAEIGEIRLSPLPPRNTAPAALFGEVRDAEATEARPAAVTVAALLSVAAPGASAVTVPLMQQGQSIATILVESNPLSCPPNVACGRYMLSVPAQGAHVGRWSALLSRVVWLQEAAATSFYSVEVARTGCDITQRFEVEATPGGLQQVPTADDLPPCR